MVDVTDYALRNALLPFATRLPEEVREHEVLRISGSLGGSARNNSSETARKHILAWVQKRVGGRLPTEAWDGETFEHMSGGRNSQGIRLRDTESDIWAVRAEDPDKTVPGRVWTTEVVIAGLTQEQCQFSARLLMSTREESPDFVPHTPGCVLQIAETCGLYRDEYELTVTPWLIGSEVDAGTLVELLLDERRRLPYYVLTVPERHADPDKPLFDADELARAVLGLGHVAIVPSEFTWAITDRLGKTLSVFGGAIRAYMPGFELDCRPYDHRLVIAERLSSPEAVQYCQRWIRTQAATESLRNTRLGHNVLGFRSIKSTSFRTNEARLVQGGASVDQKLASAQAMAESLSKELDEMRQLNEYYEAECSKSEERAKSAEEDYRNTIFINRQLKEKIGVLQVGDIPAMALPTTWDGFREWRQTALGGRLEFAPSARRGIRSPDFADVELAARCLLWLATVARDQRLGHDSRDLRDIVVEEGIRHAPCGGDKFDFHWQDRMLEADWHIKTGGNTRDPRRCLRIYYGWDDATQQIVIAEMPGHRVTGAS